MKEFIISAPTDPMDMDQYRVIPEVNKLTLVPLYPQPDGNLGEEYPGPGKSRFDKPPFPAHVLTAMQLKTQNPEADVYLRISGKDFPVKKKIPDNERLMNIASMTEPVIEHIRHALQQEQGEDLATARIKKDPKDPSRGRA